MASSDVDGTSSSTAWLDRLLSLTAGGDQAAFAELYDRTAGLVYGIALRIVRDPDRAQEVSQEAFVEAWRKAPRFDPSRGTARTWICTIAHRRAVDFVRREQALRDREERVAREVPPPVETPDDIVGAMAERAEVRSAMGQLSELQQEALRLAYFEGRTYREVAELLGAPLGTIKTRMRDGLLRLGRALEADHG